MGDALQAKRARLGRDKNRTALSTAYRMRRRGRTCHGFRRLSLRFYIEEVTADGITLAYCAKDEKYNQKWNLRRGESVFYRTHSMDAGFHFQFRLEDDDE